MPWKFQDGLTWVRRPRKSTWRFQDGLTGVRRPRKCTWMLQDGLTGVRRPRKSTWRFVYTGRIQLGAGAHVHTGRIQLGAGAQCLLLIHENAAVVCRTRLETTSRFRACGLMWRLLLHAGKIKEGEKSPKNLKTWTVNRCSANWRDPPSGISEW